MCSDLSGRRVSFSHLLSFSHSSLSFFSVFSPPLSLYFLLILPSCHLLSPSLPTLLTIPPSSFFVFIISPPLPSTFSLSFSLPVSLARLLTGYSCISLQQQLEEVRLGPRNTPPSLLLPISPSLPKASPEATA